MDNKLDKNNKKFYRHQTAIIDDGAIIGIGTKIWHWTHISSGAKIGSNCSIGQNVFIGSKAVIGNNVKIQNNVSIYDHVLIEDDVFCGPSMVFTNVINPRSEISRRSEYKNTLIKKGVTLGANSTIICGIEIGKYAFIGAGAVVSKSVKPYSLMIGVPAVHKGWISEYGEKIDLPLNGIGTWKCTKTNNIYYLENKNISKLD